MADDDPKTRSEKEQDDFHRRVEGIMTGAKVGNDDPPKKQLMMIKRQVKFKTKKTPKKEMDYHDKDRDFVKRSGITPKKTEKNTEKKSISVYKNFPTSKEQEKENKKLIQSSETRKKQSGRVSDPRTVLGIKKK